jgi:hypothetical protein
MATLLQQKLFLVITLHILETQVAWDLGSLHTLQLIIFTNTFCAMENSPALYIIKLMQCSKFY